MTMSKPVLPLADIHEPFAELRRQIRRYAWFDGIAVAVIWLGLTFWIGLGLDYLPVLMGSSEMPWWARAVLLAGISIVLLIILYRLVLRRFAHGCATTTWRFCWSAVFHSSTTGW